MTTFTQKQIAHRYGISEAQVSQAARTGKITRANGKIAIDEKLSRFVHAARLTRRAIVASDVRRARSRAFMYPDPWQPSAIVPDNLSLVAQTAHGNHFYH